MNFENLSIEKLIVHQVFQIGYDGSKKGPLISNNIIPINEELKAKISSRIIDVARKSLRVERDSSILNSAFEDIKDLAIIDKDSFIMTSKRIVELLDASQTTRNIKDSAIFIISGTHHYSDLKFSCVIKAESDNSFRPLIDDKSESIVNIESIESFLGKEQKLYKLILFIQGENNEFVHYLFDSNLTYRNTASAAKYFYREFLGADFVSQGKIAIEQFKKLSSKFIKSLPRNIMLNINALSYLDAYIKSENINTLSIDEYANNAFTDPKTHQEYKKYMISAGFNDEAIIKDFEYAKKSSLKIKLDFNSGIILSGQAIKFKENLISVVEENGDTTLKIRGSVDKIK